MESNLAKALLFYSAGVLTFVAFQNFKEAEQVQTMSLRMDSTVSDTTSAGRECACDNSLRYNIDPKEDSQNYPISTTAACSTMVASAYGGAKGAVKGFWFSKVTLDLMFCNKMDANGIYVYNAKDDAGNPVFLAEAARSNKIISHDDGSSFIYYSRAMCPTNCGVCGM